MERSGRRTVLLTAAIAEFVATFTASAVSVASQSIDEEWHVSAVTLSWISLAYILLAAALLMPAGRLADIYGRKRFFVIGMVAFTVFAFAAALAPSASVLILFRALQGVATAILYACTVALVTLAYPPENRGRALGLMVGGVYLGLTLGPLLGGIIIDNLGWRWTFAFVGVIGATNCVLAGWRLQGVEWREPRRARFDVAGSIVWAVALTLLLVGFSLLPETLGWALIAAGAAGIAGFLWRETRAADPLLNVDLLRRNRAFAYSNVATLITYAATFAVTFLISLYLEYDKGLTAQTVGLVLVTGTLVQTVFSPVAGRVADRVEARFVAAAGITACALGLGACVFLGDDTPYGYIIAALSLLGLGLAFFATPIMHVIMGSVDRNYTGVASATIGTMRMTGQNISLGLATSLLAVFVGRHAITTADSSKLLTSIRVTFALLTALCVVGLVVALAGTRAAETRDARGAADRS
jgi:EmrB/QacA subfamily drug resistance transporter